MDRVCEKMNMENSRADFMRIRRHVVDAIAAAGGRTLRFPPTRKLGEMFGVSQPTALRAVRDLIAEGYLEACKGGGTISRQAGFFHQEYEAKLFGFVTYLGTQSFDDYFFLKNRTALGLELVRRSGAHRVVDLQLESPSELERVVRESSVAGLVLLCAGPSIVEAARRLREGGIPVVSFVRPFEGLSSVRDAHEFRFEAILKRLFAEGRKRVLVYSRPEPLVSEKIREGMDAACRAAEVPAGQVILLDGMYEENRRRVAEMLDFGMTFDAVIFLAMPPSIYKLIASRLDVAEQCRMICDDTSIYDDFPFTGYVVHYDLEEAAKRVADSLFRQMDHPEEPPLDAAIDFSLELYRDGHPVGG